MKNTTSVIRGLVFGWSVGLATCVAPAQTAPPPSEPILPGRPDREGLAQTAALAPAYENLPAGISLQPPVGGKLIRRPGEQEFVRWVYPDDSAVLKVATTTLQNPRPLTVDDASKGDMGVLELAADELKRLNPATKIVRQNTTNIAQFSVGMLAARYTVATNSFLCQQALIQASDLSYYTITYITPGRPPSTPDDAPDDDRESTAVNTFAAVLDSVKLLDRTPIRADQDQRLFRTRSFFANLKPEMVEQILVPEAWMRIVRDGKDVGYFYTVEEKSTLGGQPSVKIGIRSRQFDAKKRQIDAEAWLHMTLDRKHEKWSRVSYVVDGKNKSLATEIGASDESSRPVVKAAPAGQAIGAPPQMQMIDERPLTVRYTGSTGAPEPIERMVPPWYVSQGTTQLLPRLLAQVKEPKTYLFATFITERREVMMRYYDVSREAPVKFAGQDIRAIRVEDKIGLDGYPTTHYVSPDGKYLGCESKFPDENGNDVTIAIIPTTAEELKKLWASADLSRPAEVPGVQVDTPKGR